MFGPKWVLRRRARFLLTGAKGMTKSNVLRFPFRFVITTLLFGSTVVATAPLQAQMSRAMLERLAPPGSTRFPAYRWQNVTSETVPPLGEFLHKEYANYARAPTPDSQQSNNPDNVKYVILNAQDAAVDINPFWSAPIPPGSYRPGTDTWTDACGHSHFGYSVFVGVWTFNGTSWTKYLPFRASEGRVGRRYDWVNGQYVPVSGRGKPELACHVTSDPDPSGFLSAYIWKNRVNGADSSDGLHPLVFYTARSGGSVVAQLTEAVVAMQSATHGWGGCGLFQCFMPVGLTAYKQ
jgi:hypothetical protein